MMRPKLTGGWLLVNDCNRTETYSIVPVGSELNSGSSNQGIRVFVIRTFLSAVVLANMPFWLATLFLEVPHRSVANLDYVVLVALVPYLSWPFSLALFCLLFVADTIRTSALFYYFTQHDLIASAKYVQNLPFRSIFEFASVLIVAGVVIGSAVIAVADRNRSRRNFLLLAALVVVLAGLKVAQGQVGFRFGGLDAKVGPSVVNSCTLSLVRSIWAGAPGDENSGAPAESATAHYLEAVDTKGLQGHGNVVLIIAESYGFVQDERISELLLAPFHEQQLLSRYEVQHGTVPFHGGTVSGELRELCKVRFGIPNRMDLPSWLSSCLPWKYQQLGYETWAYHGNASSMYDRGFMYPRLGFEHSIFLSELNDEHAAHCNLAFDGICDTSVAEVIRNQLHSAKRSQFVYWLTLSSHLPLPRTHGAPLFCGSDSAYPSDPDICAWANQVLILSRSVASLASDLHINDTTFLIVGDHGPPFFSRHRRGMFSEEKVPFTILLPKSRASQLAKASITIR